LGISDRLISVLGVRRLKKCFDGVTDLILRALTTLQRETGPLLYANLSPMLPNRPRVFDSEIVSDFSQSGAVCAASVETADEAPVNQHNQIGSACCQERVFHDV
jgi:hypothetical protein